MSEWISVKDRMPPNYTILLAYHRTKGIIYGYRFLDFEAAMDDPEEFAWEAACNGEPPGKDSLSIWGGSTYECNGSLDDDEVTHWMPLPEPPDDI